MKQEAGSKPDGRGSDLCPTTGWGMCPRCLSWSLTWGPGIPHREGLKPGPGLGSGWRCSSLWVALPPGLGLQRQPLDLSEPVVHLGWRVEFNTVVVKGKLALKEAAERTPAFQCMLWAEFSVFLWLHVFSFSSQVASVDRNSKVLNTWDILLDKRMLQDKQKVNESYRSLPLYLLRLTT